MSTSIAALLAAAPTPTPRDAFPTPAGFDTRVQFWAEIFGLYDERYAVVFDDRDPGLVYAIVERQTGATLPAGLLGDRAIHFLPTPGAARTEIIARYEQLASRDRGRDRTALDDVDRRLLEPHGGLAASAQALREAAAAVRIQLGARSRFALALDRLGPYRAAVEGALIGQGAPPDLVTIPLIETMFDASAVSSCGATGAWQFMPAAAQGVLRMEGIIDERRDVVAATHAAARHLLSDYRALSNWPLAVTAYNTGRTRMRRAIRAELTDDLGRIVAGAKDVRGFGHASRNYYAEFLAARALLAAQAERFPGANAVPLDVATVVAPRDVLASHLFEACGMDPDVLIALNPAIDPNALRAGFALPSGVALHVPSADANTVRACLDVEPEVPTSAVAMANRLVPDTAAGPSRAHTRMSASTE